MATDWRKWRGNRGRLDPGQQFELILRRLDLMSDALNRLTVSVATLGDKLSDVSEAIRNHPAAQDDSGELNALADRIDAGVASLNDDISTLSPAPPAPASGGDPAAAPQS